ncbi:MAG: twin-arginine translocase TatA/TatE family subunit [Bacteroides sp.]|nr:twin-arginine translocase TatA/TatE family subunit [Bacteroides sp.]
MMAQILLGFMPSGSEFLILALLVLLLFGGKKIPELMKGLGKGVKSFKEGINEAEEEIKKAKEEIDKPADADKKE